MPITELLERNSSLYPDDVALVEINPGVDDHKGHTWREFALIQSTGNSYRREMTWREFDIKANRFANLLLSRGVTRGTKVSILLMNGIEWLPIYFGILKAGAIAVPLNYRYTAEEIRYCLEKSDSEILVFGPEFVGRVEEIVSRTPKIKMWIYDGRDCPYFAESYDKISAPMAGIKPDVTLSEEDDAAIYFSSGTTGFPKAILHAHASLTHSAKVEQAHHGQTKNDVFLCIPPLYHTGAKMHWFGSLASGGRAVLLKASTAVRSTFPNLTFRRGDLCTSAHSLCLPASSSAGKRSSRSTITIPTTALANPSVPAVCISGLRTSTTWVPSARRATAGS